MDAATLVKALVHVGVTGPGMVDALARGQAHFGDENPDAEQLEAWGKQLQAEAPHLFPVPSVEPEGGVKLSAEERLTRGREAPNANKYRGLPVTEPALQEKLAAMHPTQRLTAYREWQAQQAQR